MDIQGYIIDHWLEKMSAEKPVLVIYDRDGFIIASCLLQRTEV